MVEKSRYSKILIAVDGSEVSRNVFKRGIKIAELFDSQVCVIAVVDTTTTYNFSAGMEESPMITGTEMELLKNQEKMLKEFINTLINERRDISMEIRYGIPHKEISSYAKEWEASLLVVGSYGRGGWISDLIFGSTAEKLLKMAKCDVLVVKSKDRM